MTRRSCRRGGPTVTSPLSEDVTGLLGLCKCATAGSGNITLKFISTLRSWYSSFVVVIHTSGAPSSLPLHPTSPSLFLPCLFAKAGALERLETRGRQGRVMKRTALLLSEAIEARPSAGHARSVSSISSTSHLSDWVSVERFSEPVWCAGGRAVGAARTVSGQPLERAPSQHHQKLTKPGLPDRPPCCQSWSSVRRIFSAQASSSATASEE